MILELYTDGSLIRKNGKQYVGYGIFFPNKEYQNVSNSLDVYDIHFAEMYAIKHALKIIKNDILKYQMINIYTDSYHSIKKIKKWFNFYQHNLIDEIKTKKGRDIKNKILLLEIYDIISNNIKKINLIHIKSHKRDKNEYHNNNSIADKLAKKGAKLKC